MNFFLVFIIAIFTVSCGGSRSVCVSNDTIAIESYFGEVDGSLNEINVNIEYNESSTKTLIVSIVEMDKCEKSIENDVKDFINNKLSDVKTKILNNAKLEKIRKERSRLSNDKAVSAEYQNLSLANQQDTTHLLFITACGKAVTMSLVRQIFNHATITST